MTTPTFQTLEYRGSFITIRTTGNTETIRVLYGRPDGTAKQGPTFYTVTGAKAFITRRINNQHAQALLMNALRDIGAGRWTSYMGQDLAERTTLHYARINYSNARQ